MIFSRLKQSMVSVFFGLMLLYSTPALWAGMWLPEHTCTGTWYKRVRCPIYSGHRVSASGSWGSSENIVPSIITYGCCKDGTVFSGGTVTRQLIWDGGSGSDPAPAWTLIREEADTDHVLNGSPGGYGRNTLGPANDGDYKTIRYAWVPSSSGIITRTHRLEAKVEAGPSSEASVCVSYISLSAEWSGDHIDWSKCPGAKVDRTHVEPPPRAQSQPYHPAPPCYNRRSGAVPGKGDPVNLATGEHLYVPGPDISVYNPYGPAVVYQRNFFSKLAKEGKSSPGLPVGWIDGFDVKFVSLNPTAWGNLKLVYPNSAEEKDFVPTLDGGGTPTGEFTEPTGCEYIVTGVASSTIGQWDSLTITYKDRTKWQFSRVSADTYVLSAIISRMGRAINLLRDTANRVLTVQDDQASPVTLLSLGYTDGLLSSLTDAYGRKVNYTYEDFGGVTCLKSVSQISTSGTAPVAAQYGYQLLGSPTPQPHLTSVSIPSPTGSGMSTESFAYDADVRVASMTDANGNTHHFNYESPDATKVEMKNPSSILNQRYLAIFDPAHSNVLTGIADDGGGTIAKAYDDNSNPELPTKLVDKLGQATEVTYDQYGNVLTEKSPRGTITTYTYEYEPFPLGRLKEIDQASNLSPTDPAKKPKTTFSYYEPSGLIQSITYPKPGSTGPNGETVTTSFTYDALGNILTKASPGNNAAGTITTTYNYTQDGEYSQPAKIGQPLTITDNLGHVTHFRYDDRGNTISARDALGNETNFISNIADQQVTIIHPSTQQPP